MPKLFIHVVNMSISASYVILAMLLLRLLLKKAPKWITVALWGIVAFRLICPISFESVFSLIPSAQVVSPEIMMDHNPQIDSGISFLNLTLNELIADNLTPAIGESMNPLQLWIPVLAVFWIVGILVLFGYAFFRYIKLKRMVATAVRYQDGVFQSENVDSPFVLGIFQPRIYLPFHMNETDMVHVIAHEQAHILRNDHLWKVIGFTLVMMHWFNPLAWLGYLLFCRDLEFACDEKAIKLLDCDKRADYSEALLNCTVKRVHIFACPLAFGEVGVKKRIKSVLNYQKPVLWISILVILLSVAVAFAFLTNPVSKDSVGINNIKVSAAGTDTINLNLGYSIPTGGYGVRYVPESEGEYSGDGMIGYDGALGKYRIFIAFGDTDISAKLKEKYHPGEVIELENAPVKMRMKIVHPQTHGCGIYVGFDVPISVSEVNAGELYWLGGWATIPITLLRGT